MNAKQEFIEFCDGLPDVKCAWVCTGDETPVILKVGHTRKDYEEFLKLLDFSYNAGYGTQELYGFIWLVNGAWAERAEYDGSEWWEYKSIPVIPKDLLNKI